MKQMDFITEAIAMLSMVRFTIDFVIKSTRSTIEQLVITIEPLASNVSCATHFLTRLSTLLDFLSRT